MSIDRQRIAAVTTLQELGFKWDGTTWVSNEKVGIMGVGTFAIPPAPMPGQLGVQGSPGPSHNPAQLDVTSQLLLAGGDLLRAISRATVSVAPKVEVRLDRPVFRMLVAAAVPTYPNLAHNSNAFTLGGVEYRSN